MLVGTNSISVCTCLTYDPTRSPSEYPYGGVYWYNAALLTQLACFDEPSLVIHATSPPLELQ